MSCLILLGFTKAVDVVHANGGIFIADEVQPGFARTGDSFWGFGRHNVVPDIITTGKPMGNGVPVSGLLAKSEVLAALAIKFHILIPLVVIRFLWRRHRLYLK